MKASLFLWVFLWVGVHGVGQVRQTIGSGAMLSIGSIIKNYPVFPDRGLSTGATLEWYLKTTGTQQWHRKFHFPDAGMLLSYYRLGNAEILGTVAGIQAFLRVPLSPQSPRGMFYFRPAMGFAWFSKPYNKISNPTNLLAGSHLSNITTLELQYGKKFTTRVEGLLSIGFTHYSNGHTSLPNVGTNFPSLSAGIRYLPTCRLSVKDSTGSFSTQGWRMNAEFMLGMHEFGETTEPTDGRKYPVYGASLFFTKTTRVIHGWSLGLTWNYYTSFYDFIKAEELFKAHEKWKASTLIIFGGHEFLAGHLGIDTRVGLYLFNPFRIHYSKEIIRMVEHLKLWNTNRLALNFYLHEPARATPNAWIGMYIKANAGQADFAGISAGFRF